MEGNNRVQSDNKGLTLVELIVAISIAVIVSASVSALIAFAVKTYHNESVNTAMQYELQTNVNQVMDSIMSSSGVVIVNNISDGRTEYAGFGQFKETRDETDPERPVTSVDFSGVVLASYKPAGSSYYEIYMNRVSSVTGDTARKAVENAVNPIKNPASEDDRKVYLLGQNATKFNLSIDPGCLVSGTEYINPLSIDVELEFEKDGTGKTINKTVKDNAIMRNKVTADIYVNETKYVLKK